MRHARSKPAEAHPRGFSTKGVVWIAGLSLRVGTLLGSVAWVCHNQGARPTSGGQELS